MRRWDQDFRLFVAHSDSEQVIREARAAGLQDVTLVENWADLCEANMAVWGSFDMDLGAVQVRQLMEAHDVPYSHSRHKIFAAGPLSTTAVQTWIVCGLTDAERAKLSVLFTSPIILVANGRPVYAAPYKDLAPHIDVFLNAVVKNPKSGLLSTWTDRKREIVRATKDFRVASKNHKASPKQPKQSQQPYESLLLRAVEARFGTAHSRVITHEILNRADYYPRIVDNPGKLQALLEAHANGIPPEKAKKKGTPMTLDLNPPPLTSTQKDSNGAADANTGNSAATAPANQNSQNSPSVSHLPVVTIAPSGRHAGGKTDSPNKADSRVDSGLQPRGDAVSQNKMPDSSARKR